MIIDGRKIREEMLKDIAKNISMLSFAPVFCDILVGSDPASAQYVRMKAKTAESVGIKFYPATFPDAITTEELIEEIRTLNHMPNMSGIIVQLPLPSHLDRQKILDAIDPLLDVDCLGSVASKMFYENNNPIGFPTALACIKALDSTAINLADKNIIVLGRGNLVGKPVAHLLQAQELKIQVIHSTTENPEVLIKQADVIISGIGKGKFITGDKIKKGSIVIDAGTSEDNGGIVGDVDLASVLPVASYVSPTPGGVGPITVAMLLNNVLQVAQKITVIKK